MSNKRLKELALELRVCDLTRQSYQKLLNDYDLTHEKQTTMDFHHQLKGAILDAVDEELIKQNPTQSLVKIKRRENAF